MSNFLTYMYLLTPLHTGGSADEGNLMGIAREVHTEFPYLPSSSLRGRIRAEIETKATPELKESIDLFFGKKIKNGSQPTEGEVWFADATLLFFPIASLSHHLIWVTCPLWLERWSRWIGNSEPMATFIEQCHTELTRAEQPKSAVLSFSVSQLYLQTAILKSSELVRLDFTPIKTALMPMMERPGLIGQLLRKAIVLTNEDCIALVEMGLQREVRVALEEKSKTVKGGSFRSEEAIPPETILFFPWGTKPAKEYQPLADEKDKQATQKKTTDKQANDKAVRNNISQLLDGKRLQFGGLEGLGRGWADLTTSTTQQEST